MTEFSYKNFPDFPDVAWVKNADIVQSLVAFGYSNIQLHSHWGVKGGRVPPLTANNLPKIGKKRGKNQEKSEKKRKNHEEKAKIMRFFHFASPDR